jgi:4-amino-4-deoxy-L-arabinose transferase-like glycosyltransferase
VVVWRLPFGTPKLGDGFFHRDAKTLALAVRGVEPWRDFSIFRAPAPVLFYAIPYIVVSPGSTNDQYWRAAFVWTIGWMLLSLLLIRRTAEWLGGGLAGKLAVCLMLVTPFWVYYSYGILAESPAFLGVVLFTYGWVRWERSGQRPSLRAKGAWPVCLGISLFILSRPNALLLLGFALLAAAWQYRAKLPQGIRVAKFTLLTVVVVSLVFGAATAGVQALPKHPQGEFLAYIVFNGAFQFRTEPWDWHYWDKISRRGSVDYAAWDRAYKEISRQSKETGIAASDLMAKWLKQDVVEHPFLWTRMAAVRTLALHTSFVNSKRPEAFRVGPISGWLVYVIFHVLVNAVNVLLIGGAIWFLITRWGQLASHWPLWGPWLSLALFHMVVYAEPRYLFPVRPCITIMAAAALTPSVARVLARFQARAIAAGASKIGSRRAAEEST